MPKGVIKQEVLSKAHHTIYYIHSSETNIYQDLKIHFSSMGHGMERDIKNFVSKYLVCQQVKAKHQKAPRLFQLYPYLSKNERRLPQILFMTLLCSPKDNNSIQVTIYQLTKVAHLLSLCVGQPTEALAKKFMPEMMRLHSFLKYCVKPRYTIQVSFLK